MRQEIVYIYIWGNKLIVAVYVNMSHPSQEKYILIIGNLVFNDIIVSNAQAPVSCNNNP